MEVNKIPKAFDDMVSAIKKSLKSQYPKLSDDELTSKAYAMATAQWKKKHGSAPSRENFILEYSVPFTFTEGITESDLKDFMIEGTAISETTTLNNHKYIAEELEKAASSLLNKPLLVDHDQKVENIKGKVISANWDPASKSIPFKAKITDEKIKEMIKQGILSTVSVGAYAKELIEDKDGGMIAKGISFAELSLVPCPADENATFVMAMCEALKLHEQMMKCPECGYEGEMKKMEKESQSTIQVGIKGGKEMETTLEDNSKVIAELQERIKVFEAEKRQALIESYKKLCNEKNVSSLDVTSFSNEAISVLMEQLKSVKVITTEKAEVKEEIKDDGFVIERSARGFALFKR